jgi:hypothetical protein
MVIPMILFPFLHEAGQTLQGRQPDQGKPQKCWGKSWEIVDFSAAMQYYSGHE